MLDALKRPRRLVKAHLDAEHHQHLQHLARSNDRSLAAEMRQAIITHLRAHQGTREVRP